MAPHDRHIVAVVDDSAASIALLDWAATYAAMTGADVKLVSGWRRHALRDHGPARADDDMPAALEERLQHFVGQTCTGFPHQVVVAKAEPAALPLREPSGADLIVVRAQLGDYDKRLGSAIQTPLRQAACPVVVVPTAPQRTESTHSKEES